MTTTERRTWADLMKYDGPVGEGPGDWSVTVTEADPIQAFKYALDGRPSGKGPFHVLRHRGQLWMSDTEAEMRDHFPAVYEMRQYEVAGITPSVLIHGLGMGLVVAAALRLGARVDVVEIDAELVDWMEPWLQEEADKWGGTLTVHVSDVFDMKWEPGSYWDVVWHDIWPDICEDNREQMTKLARSFGRRSGWQGVWGKYDLDRVRRRGYSSW